MMEVDSGKFVIRMRAELHLRLKELAHSKRKSLNQTCLDLIQAGLQKSSQQEIIIEIRSLYEAKGLVAILKTEGHVADYVLLFAAETELRQSIKHQFKKIIQLTKMPQTEHVPDNLWIQIARTYRMLWSKDPHLEQEISTKLDQW